ncbi:MAG: hypothetical protein WBZ36_12505 [Candidatus Nitrosopolaris sp.]
MHSVARTRCYDVDIPLSLRMGIGEGTEWIPVSRLIKSTFGIQSSCTWYSDQTAKNEIVCPFGASRDRIAESIRQQRMLKMMTIADDRHFSYDDEIELVQFIATEIQKEGSDLNNEENLDST